MRERRSFGSAMPLLIGAFLLAGMIAAVMFVPWVACPECQPLRLGRYINEGKLGICTICGDTLRTTLHKRWKWNRDVGTGLENELRRESPKKP